MKTKTFFNSLLVAIMLGVLPGQAADTKAVPTIVVAKTDGTRLSYWQPAMGDGLAQMLITELSALPNFKVLESVALDDLRSERQLGDSGEVDASESVKKGQWKGADYTFKSVVTRFGSKNNNYGGGGWAPHLPGLPGGYHNFSISKSENEVQIDWRIIDNASREVIATGRADGIETGTGFNFSSWNGGGFNNNREFMDSALGKATMKAIAQITDKVKTLDIGPGARTLNNQSAAAAKTTELRSVKGTVQLVDGKEIWISLGTDHGFAKGDKVKIYKAVPKLNKKGEVVTTDYELATEITLEKVQKSKSMGLNPGSAQVTEDMAVADSAVDIDQLQ